MQVINVPVADRPECRVALDFSFKLAKTLSASVVGCHLRPHRHEAELQKNRLLPYLFAARRDAGKDNAKTSTLKSKAAKALFMEMAEKSGFAYFERARRGIANQALWTEMVGDLSKLFPIVGPIADLAILSRPKKSSTGPGADFLVSALLHSGKPVLVLPQTPMESVGTRVLIAWNQGIESARAVSAAMPFLSRAEAVTILACGPENQVGPKSTHLAQYLKLSGVKASTVRTRGRDVEKELDAEYRKMGGDLVVMGGYSRSRVRELVFGGMTHHMLFGTAMPLFVLHV